MKFKRTCYIVFIFILCTIFSSEVKALVADQESGVANGTGSLSCAYFDEENAYKLEIDKTGSLTLYEPVDGKKSTVISGGGLVSWSGQWKVSKEFMELYQENGTVADIKGKSFTSCLGAIIKTKKTVMLVDVYKESLEDMTDDPIMELKSQITKVVSHTEGVNNDFDSLYSSCKDVGNWDDMWLNKNFSNYHANCLYSLNAGNQCIVVQLDITNGGKIDVSSNYKPAANFADYEPLAPTFNDNYITGNGGWCPKLWLRKTEVKDSTDVYDSLSMASGGAKKWLQMDFRGQKGKNYVNPSLDMSAHNYGGTNIVFLENSFSCNDIKNGEIGKLLKYLVNLIKIIVPILLIVFGSLDFGSAIFSGDDGSMKKAQAKFIKRVVIAVVIFLVPSILKLLLTVAGSVWPSISADLCGILD